MTTPEKHWRDRLLECAEKLTEAYIHSFTEAAPILMECSQCESGRAAMREITAENPNLKPLFTSVLRFAQGNLDCRLITATGPGEKALASIPVVAIQTEVLDNGVAYPTGNDPQETLQLHLHNMTPGQVRECFDKRNGQVRSPAEIIAFRRAQSALKTAAKPKGEKWLIRKDGYIVGDTFISWREHALIAAQRP